MFIEHKALFSQRHNGCDCPGTELVVAGRLADSDAINLDLTVSGDGADGNIVLAQTGTIADLSDTGNRKTLFSW